MNQKALDYFSSLRGKRVAVLGLGISHRPLIRLLCRYGAEVTACDRRPGAADQYLRKELSGLNVRLSLGDGYLDGLTHDIIFKTPGMRHDIPELMRARQNGSVVTSEMELFFELCPAKIIAVTGSDGKTTTTTLVRELLAGAGRACRIGGNIGKPLLPEIEGISEDEIIVLELSSFQLMSMHQSPGTAVVTNITPNHLDIHKSMEEYIEAKRNIVRFQKPGDTAVLNADNPISLSFADGAAGDTVLFSRKKEVENGVFEKDGVIFDARPRQKPRPVLRAADIVLPGGHNVENYMAAYAAVRKLIPDGVLKAVAGAFQGVPHRIEFVREHAGVRYYNDSIATSPARCMAGLRAFDRRVVLIAGGYDKRLPFDELAREICERVKLLVLTGQAAQKISRAVTDSPGYSPDKTHIIVTGGFDDAVLAAARGAKPGDIVLLSPACASFDMFRNFEERGERFREIVTAL